MRPRLAGLLLSASVLSACSVTPTPDPTSTAALVPPEIEFAGLVSDVRVYPEHYEFTDAAGIVHAIDFGDYRQVGEHDCCGPLIVLGRDAEGAFMASFLTQGGLPDDCYVENDVGIDRGSHVEILGILWRKAPGFGTAAPFGTTYAPGTRFCFDKNGRVASTVAP